MIQRKRMFMHTIIVCILLTFLQVTNAQTGNVTWEIWKNKVTNLGDLPTFFDLTNPTQTGTRTDLCFMGSGAELGGDLNDFVYRMHGFIYATETGTYTFYSASDDDGQFWINLNGTATDKASLTKVAGTNGWSNNKEWGNSNNYQTSQTLEAGKYYYFVAFFREGNGGDGLTLGWKTPSAPGTVNCIGSANISLTAGSKIKVSSLALHSGNLQKNSTSQILQKIALGITQTDATLSGITFQTKGNYTATDVINFKLWFNATSATLTGASQIGSTITSAASGSDLAFTGISTQITNNTTGYLILTADISAGATVAKTIGINTLAFVDITFSTSAALLGTDPVAATADKSIISAKSKLSDLIIEPTFTSPSNINYANYTGSNYLEVAQLQLRDGGAAANDADASSTTLSEITLNVTNWANISKIAIFDGATKIAESAAVASTTISNLGVEALQGSNKVFSIKVTYNNIVTDNLQNIFTLASAIADGNGSGFATANAGGAVTSSALNVNKVVVTATKLVFSTQPSATALFGGTFLQPAIVSAVDASGSVDLDYVSNITLANSASLSMNNNVLASVTGVATFTSFNITGVGNNFTLSATSGSLTAATSAAVSVFSPISGNDGQGDMGSDVVPGNTNQRILRVVVKSIATSSNPYTISNLTFNLGSTTNAADITGAGVYEVDQDNNTQYNKMFGTITSVVGGKISIDGNFVMTETKDYTFDVTVNISENALDGHKIDAAIETAMINGTLFSATTGNGSKTRNVLNQGFTGTINVDNTLGANVKGTAYKDFGAMLTDLNKYGVGIGGLTVVVKDDQTYSYTSAIQLNQGGRSGSPLTIKRSGTGTNAPIISVRKGGSYYNHLFIINNASYLTIDGITFKGADGGDGNSKYFSGLSFACKSNETFELVEIKNCIFDINVLKDINSNEDRFSGIGVRFSYTHEGASTSCLGGVKNLKIHHNQFMNIREGVRIERRDLKVENVEIFNNTISNFFNVGINIFGGDVDGPIAIHDNEISTANIDMGGDWGGILDLDGIRVSNVVGNASIYNNKIHDLTNINANSRQIGMALRGNNANAKFDVYNNMIWNLNATNSTSSEPCVGFLITNQGNINLYFNTVLLNYTTSAANHSRVVLVWDQPKVELANNIFVNKVNVSGSAKASVLDIDPAKLTSGTDNNLYYAGTPSANNLINGYGNKQTLADYKTQAAGKELNSLTDTVPFISATNLHLRTDVVTKIESGGKVIASPAITTDIDGDTRNNVLPDIGADEGNFKEFFVNHVPTINSVPKPAPIYTADGQQTLNLAGISDGDPNKTQAVTVTAISSNSAAIRIDAIDYVANATTATLKYTPVAAGSATITIKVKDDGGIANNGKDTVVITFLVVAEDAALNNAPLINAVSNVKIYTTETSKTINLSGIADGDRNKVQTLAVTATTDKDTVVTNLQVNYTSDNAIGTITFKPGKVGMATVKVKVKDNGGIVNNGVDTTIISFTVEVKEPNGSGFVEDFNDNAITNWYAGSYKLKAENQMLKIDPVKPSVWDGFGMTFEEITIKDNPVVTLRIKSNFDFNISMAIGNPRESIRIDNYPLGININGMSSQEIVASDEFQEYSFDYTGIASAKLDSINNLHFVLNPLTRDFGSAPNKAIYFEDIKIGGIAKRTPAITNIENQVFTVTASGTDSRTINFRNVTDGSTDNNTIIISATSSNPSVLPDPQVLYTSPSRKGKLVLNPNVSASGDAVVSVIVSAPNVSDKIMTFKVKVQGNIAPSMKAIPDVLVKKGELVKVFLDDIFDGNPEVTQEIAISAISSNTTIIPVVNIKHDSTDFTGMLSFTPAPNTVAGSEVTVTVKLKDNGGILNNGVDTAKYSFKVTVYDEVNNTPTIKTIYDKGVKAIAGTFQIPLEGISDGDNGSQVLTFDVTSKLDSIIGNFAVTSVVNGLATLNYDLTGKTGIDTLTIKITDNGGKVGNNGNQSVSKSFIITALPAPLTGLVLDYKPFIANVAASGLENQQNTPVTEIMADGTVHFGGIVKQATYPSLNFYLSNLTGGKNIDISANKYVSFKFKGASSNKITAPSALPYPKTNIQFRLIDNIVPGQSTSGYGISVITNDIPNDDQWHDVFLDFSGKFYKDKDGKQTDSTRITRLMLDVSDTWFQEIVGDYYFKDIKIGDVADRPVLAIHPAIGDIPSQVIYKGQSAKPVVLKGINDGAGKLTAKLTAYTNKPALVSNIAFADVINGTSQLTFDVNSNVTDTAKVYVIANNTTESNVIPDTVMFKVYVIDTATIVNNNVTIDFSKTYQTFAGMGTMLNNNSDPAQIKHIKDLNLTLMRFTSSSEFEPVNDNSDPNVYDFSSFNHGAIPTNTIKNIIENTNCKKFFYTPWTPANWMKQNKGSNPDPAAMWAGNNKLMPEMYEEFAEYLAAICKTFKEETGTDLYAISLQNEPTFNEPYASCQYTGEEFRDIMKIIGPKFEAENINTRIMMPEDIATMLDWVTEKINPVNADPIARKYLDIMAVHLYDPDGINVGGAGSSRWTELLNIKKTTTAEGLWMTETSGFCNVWEGYWGKDYMHGTDQFFPGPFDFAGSIYTAFKAGNISGWTDFEGSGFKTVNDLAGSAFKNFSAYINPGSVMVDATSSNSKILSLAFKNADNTTTSILLNTDTKPLKVTLKGVNVPKVYRAFTTQNFAPFTEGNLVTNGAIILPPRSITTLYHTESNLPPVIDPIANATVELSKGAFDVNLTGIGNGDFEKNQTIAITVASDNGSVADAIVNYTTGSTGTITVTPKAYGTVKFTVMLKDNGGIANGGIDSAKSVFYVNVIDGINQSPTINQISDLNLLEDAVEQTINLSGITDGDGKNQQLTFKIVSDNTALIADFTLGYSPNATDGTIKFKPIANSNGTAKITVFITDNGGTAYNNGNQITKQTFNVTVTPVNDAPKAKFAMTAFLNYVPGGEASIPITSITNRDANSNQTLNFVVRNPNPDKLFDVTFDPITNNASKLYFKTASSAQGSASFNVVLFDNGGTANKGVDSSVYKIVVLFAKVNITENVASFALFPNPTTDKLYVQFANEVKVKIEISDINGRILLQHNNVNATTTQIDVSKLSEGLYIVSVESGDKIVRSSFVKK